MADDIDALADNAAAGRSGAAPREAWYAAIAASRLGDKPVAARALDRALALWRGADGVARAVQDRCAHRGAQLSLGEVTDSALACRYHGWRYGAGGACVHIPSLLESQRVPRGIGVRSYPCVEQDGYLFVWMGEAPAPAPAAPPPIPDFARFNWAQGVVQLRCEALAVIENNLDWCHPVFAHPFTHGQFFINQAMGFREQLVEMRLTERGVVVFTPPTGDAAAPIPAEPQVSLAFELPDRVTVGFAAGPQGAMRIVMHMVPTGPGACRQEWLVSIGPATPGAAPNVTWTDEPNAIFEQDKLVLESAQLAFEREGHGFERSVEADAPTLAARRVYAAAAAGRWPAARERLVQRRILTVRS